MIFRPKIFISSTFKDNENIRQKVRDYFYSVGAEPLLYEKELTPSVLPMTYRENIKDSDFVILIIKENYGTPTDWNISGTHEEYLIAHENKIPIHVYLLKTAAAASGNQLIEDLKKDGISYYYFDNDAELYNKLIQTTFTIAKEIMISQVEKNNLPEKTIVKLAGNLDYQKAISIIQIIESMKICVEKYEMSYIENNIILACFQPIYYEFKTCKHYFINWKLNELFSEMLNIVKEFTAHYGLDFTSKGDYRDYPIAVLGRIHVSNSSYYQNTDWLIAKYHEELEKLFEKFEVFKRCVQDLRTEVDIIC